MIDWLRRTKTMFPYPEGWDVVEICGHRMVADNPPNPDDLTVPEMCAYIAGDIRGQVDKLIGDVVMDQTTFWLQDAPMTYDEVVNIVHGYGGVSETWRRLREMVLWQRSVIANMQKDNGFDDGFQAGYAKAKQDMSGDK
jgi:hypothetical protein